MSYKKQIKKAKQKLEEFSPRGGSNCPLCGKEFRYGCDHSIQQAKEHMKDRILKLQIRQEISKEMKRVRS